MSSFSKRTEIAASNDALVPLSNVVARSRQAQLERELTEAHGHQEVIQALQSKATELAEFQAELKAQAAAGGPGNTAEVAEARVARIRATAATRTNLRTEIEQREHELEAVKTKASELQARLNLDVKLQDADLKRQKVEDHVLRAKKEVEQVAEAQVRAEAEYDAEEDSAELFSVDPREFSELSAELDSLDARLQNTEDQLFAALAEQASATAEEEEVAREIAKVDRNRAVAMFSAARVRTQAARAINVIQVPEEETVVDYDAGDLNSSNARLGENVTEPVQNRRIEAVNAQSEKTGEIYSQQAELRESEAKIAAALALKPSSAKMASLRILASKRARVEAQLKKEEQELAFGLAPEATEALAKLWIEEGQFAAASKRLFQTGGGAKAVSMSPPALAAFGSLESQRANIEQSIASEEFTISNECDEAAQFARDKIGIQATKSASDVVAERASTASAKLFAKVSVFKAREDKLSLDMKSFAESLNETQRAALTQLEDLQRTRVSEFRERMRQQRLTTSARSAVDQEQLLQEYREEFQQRFELIDRYEQKLELPGHERRNRQLITACTRAYKSARNIDIRNFVHGLNNVANEQRRRLGQSGKRAHATGALTAEQLLSFYDHSARELDREYENALRDVTHAYDVLSSCLGEFSDDIAKFTRGGMGRSAGAKLRSAMQGLRLRDTEKARAHAARKPEKAMTMEELRAQKNEAAAKIQARYRGNASRLRKQEEVTHLSRQALASQYLEMLTQDAQQYGSAVVQTAAGPSWVRWKSDDPGQQPAVPNGARRLTQEENEFWQNADLEDRLNVGGGIATASGQTTLSPHRRHNIDKVAGLLATRIIPAAEKQLDKQQGSGVLPTFGKSS